MSARIKICGITHPDFAQAAESAGAHAIGLMFYPPSKRHLELDQAAVISKALGPLIHKVAVMVDPSKEYVNEIITRVGVQCLQFHGDESEAFCQQFGLPYVKSLRVGSQTSQDILDYELKYPSASAILLDTHVTGQYGGTGQAFDWSRSQYGGAKPIILAGGLTPENVFEAISQVQPYAVDVSSGVEMNGVKDIAKIKMFCNQVLKNNI